VITRDAVGAAKTQQKKKTAQSTVAASSVCGKVGDRRGASIKLID